MNRIAKFLPGSELEIVPLGEVLDHAERRQPVLDVDAELAKSWAQGYETGRMLAEQEAFAAKLGWLLRGVIFGMFIGWWIGG